MNSFSKAFSPMQYQEVPTQQVQTFIPKLEYNSNNFGESFIRARKSMDKKEKQEWKDLGYTNVEVAGDTQSQYPTTSYSDSKSMSIPKDKYFQYEDGEIELTYIKGKRAIKYPDGTIKYGGHRNWRTNNPFNIKATKSSLNRYKKYGALGADHAGDSVEKDWRGIVFSTREGGIRAGMDLLKRAYKNYNVMTIGKKFQIGLSPTQYGNNIKKFLPEWFPVNKPIGAMTDEELYIFANAQTKAEGTKAGYIISSSN